MLVIQMLLPSRPVVLQKRNNCEKKKTENGSNWLCQGALSGWLVAYLHLVCDKCMHHLNQLVNNMWLRIILPQTEDV
jgi:hypothetical protein